MAVVASGVTSAASDRGREPSAAVVGPVHGPGSPLAETKRTCARIAASEATVLLTGETGTGKEVIARFIHASSPRAARPFVPVNCGAIPETLLESELFGYVRGAFTGAVGSRRGRVAMAEGGTLFLDEIGELPLALQVKLLRLLQERTYEPVGSSESVPASFRLIAATNRNLADEVRGGRFRSDLFYRLHVCPIRLPALRERTMDIAPLFSHFWAKRGDRRPIDPAVLRCLERYEFPGNVRELENLVERVSVCAEGEVICVSDLPPGVADAEREVAEAEAEAALARAAEAAVARSAAAAAAADAAAEEEGDAIGGAVPAEEISIAAGTSGAVMLLRTVEGAAGDGDGGGAAGEPEVLALPSLAAMAEELRARVAAATAAASAASVVGAVPVSLGEGNTPTPVLELPIDLPTMLRELENAYINAALARTRSNKKEAAKLLGMGRTTLVEKLRRRASDRRDPSADE